MRSAREHLGEQPSVARTHGAHLDAAALAERASTQPRSQFLEGLAAAQAVVAFGTIDKARIVVRRPVRIRRIEAPVAAGDLPASDRGADAFVVQDGKGGFRTTPDYGRDENGIFFDNAMKLLEDGTLEGGVVREMRM